MNKLKFIPSLAIVALLSACGAKGVNKSVKEPKFEKFSKEVEKADFFEDLGKEIQKMDIFTNAKKLGSNVATLSAKELTDTTLTRDKKVFSDDYNVIAYDLDVKNDTKNIVSLGTGTYTLTRGQKYSDKENAEMTQKNEFVTYYQEVEYDGKDYLAYVNSNGKVVNPVSQVSDEYPIDILFDGFLSEMLMYELEIYSAISKLTTISNIAADAPEAEYYTFYEDGKAFTVVYEFAPAAEEIRDNETDALLQTNEEKEVEKIQFVIDGQDLKLMQYHESSIKTTFNVDTTTPGSFYYAGDVYEQVNKTTSSSSLQFKDVTVKPANIDGFVFDLD